MSNTIDKNKLRLHIKCPVVGKALDNHSGDLTSFQLVEIIESTNPRGFDIIDYTVRSPTSDELHFSKKILLDKVISELELLWQDGKWTLDLNDKQVKKDIFSKLNQFLTEEERVYKFYWCLKSRLPYDSIPAQEIKLKNPDFENTIQNFWKTTIVPMQKSHVAGS